MSVKKHFTDAEAKHIGEKIGIKWDKFDVGQFRKGMDVELEHGANDPATNVTNNDPLITGKIALAHLNEFPDYYDRLEKMEEEGIVGPIQGAKPREVYLKEVPPNEPIGRRANPQTRIAASVSR